MAAPGVTSRFPAGITDSLYFPRPADWYSKPVEETPMTGVIEEEPHEVPPVTFESFLEKA